MTAAIAAITDMPLEEALALVEGRFDSEGLLARPLGAEGVTEYYRQSDRGYRMFHSKEGALHIALGGDGRSDTGCYSRQAELFAEQLDATGADNAIELGCGMGYNVCWLAAACPQRELLGVDLTEPHIKFAQKASAELPNARFEVANYEQLPHEDNAFGGALAVETLCQTPTLEHALAEAQRVLRPGARLVVIDCFRAAPLESYDPPLARAARLVERSTAVESFSVVQDFIASAESVGLKLVEDRDLSAQTGDNLARLYSLAKRFFKMPAAARIVSRTLPKRLLENSIAGLLMPFTVGGGAHSYRQIVFEK